MKRRATVSAAAINKDCAQIKELANPRFGSASGKVQRSFRIDGAIDIGCMLLARVMNSSCQVHDCVDTDERFFPIGVWAEGIYDDRICVGRGLSHGLSDDHTVSRQHWSNVSA